VFKNVWAAHIKTWSKSWTLGTRMPKLTRAALRRLIKKTGRHSDGGGLYFRMIGEGKAYFVYRYRVDGRERETSLGPFPELTLAEAREKHAALRKRVVVDHADPLAEKRGAKTVKAVTAVPTFGDMADAYVQTHEATWRNAKRRYQWRQTLTAYCGPIRDTPVNEIGHSRRADGPEAAVEPRAGDGVKAQGAHPDGHRGRAGPRRGQGQPSPLERPFGPLAGAAEEARRAWTSQSDALRSVARVRESLARLRQHGGVSLVLVAVTMRNSKASAWDAMG
jgi:hypothetical protein